MKKKWKKRIKLIDLDLDMALKIQEGILIRQDHFLEIQKRMLRRVERLELDSSDLDSELTEEPPMNSIIIDDDAMSWQRFTAGWYANSWDLTVEASGAGEPLHGGTPKTWEYMMEKCRPMQLIISGEKVWTSSDREQFGKNRD